MIFDINAIRDGLHENSSPLAGFPIFPWKENGKVFHQHERGNDILPSISYNFFFHHRQNKDELRSFAFFTFDPDFSAMRLHCEPTKCQTNAQSTRFIFALETRELFEDAFTRVGRNAWPTILHPESHIRAVHFRSDLDYAFG